MHHLLFVLTKQFSNLLQYQQINIKETELL